MGFHAGQEYFSLPTPDHTWILNNVLPVGGMLNIYGKPKTGKSMIGLQLASAIASGKSEWLSFGISVHGPVAYLQVDTPRSLWVERALHLERFGLDFSNVLFADREDPDFPYPFDIMGEGYRWLEKNISLLSPRPITLIIDTLREIHAGSEDESGHMKNVISQTQAAVPGLSIVFISHSRKGNPQQFGFQPDIMDENRGSSYVPGRMDCVMALSGRSLTAKGRALPDTEVGVEMHPESFEVLLADPFLKEAVELVGKGRKMGVDEKGMVEILHNRFPKKSIEVCRSVVHRLIPATVGRRLPLSSAV